MDDQQNERPLEPDEPQAVPGEPDVIPPADEQPVRSIPAADETVILTGEPDIVPPPAADVVPVETPHADLTAQVPIDEDIVQMAHDLDLSPPAAPDEATVIDAPLPQVEAGIDEETVLLAQEPDMTPAPADITFPGELHVPPLEEVVVPSEQQEPSPEDIGMPPRIVSETPLGGVPRPTFAPPPPTRAPEPAPAEEAATPPAGTPVRTEPPPAGAEATVYNIHSEAPTMMDVPVTPPPPPARPEPVLPATKAEPATEWDEEISPELASVLFQAAEPTRTFPAPPPPAAAVPPPPGVQPRVEPVPRPLPGEPTILTDIADARRLRIAAQGVASPAPDAPLLGKGRYVRIEEPLPGGSGQQITESWEYLKSDRPPLEGRLVKSVRAEEVSYGDGSWRWHYERRYTDGGYDRRTVKANADRTYIERRDELKKPDPVTGKPVTRKEHAAMIFAPPPQEEKRRLFGRRKAPEPSGPKAWRTATEGEIKRNRKLGGRAF